MTTLGGKSCDVRGCTKNQGHASEHRIPVQIAKAQGRTLAQAVGAVGTCGAVLQVRINEHRVEKHRCKKPISHHSNHHSGVRSWA